MRGAYEFNHDRATLLLRLADMIEGFRNFLK